MPDVVFAIDQGTTSTRCMVFNQRGEPVARHQLEHKQYFPKPGWVEHDPEEIWQKTQTVLRETARKAGAAAADIAAVGITNQRETALVWNRQTGRPYHNAIVWQDVRTDQITTELAKDGGQDRFRAQTGLPLATYFSGPKIKWLLDNVKGLQADAERGLAVFGNMDSWLIWNLTGGPDGGKHVTDVTNASRTLLMDLRTLDWDEGLCAAMGVPVGMLPRIASSSEILGHTRPDGPLAGSVKVAGDLGDQQAATVGQVCFEPGEAKNTYGTGCFMLLNTGEEIVQSDHGLLTTVAYRFGEEAPVYALEGSIAITGALVQWLRDNLALIDTSPEIEHLANTVDDNGGVYFVPAFSGLFAPYWRSDARGAILGLTRYANRGHIARAALEATAYQTREVLDAMNADSGVELKSLRVDGGMVGNDLLMQFQADVLGVPVTRPMVPETTALGAAYAAGYAVDFWADKQAMRRNWRPDKTWQPGPESPARDELFAQWKKAVTHTFDWID
jgi:glycerol kinase